ncbi:MAG: hypothetical protein AB1847_00265 [bacterium]
MGIPLHVVIQGIDKTFENLRSSGLQHKRVNYLGYCEPEILNVWREYRKKSHPASCQTGSEHPGSCQTGSGYTGSAAYACTDVQAAYATSDARTEKAPVQEQKEIREYVDRKISLLIEQVTRSGETWEKNKSDQKAVGAGQEPRGDHRESGDDTMKGILHRTFCVIRLEEELADLRQETQKALRIDVDLIEKRLQKLDKQLVQSLFAGLPPHKRNALLSSAEKQTRRYKNQMEIAAYQETIQAYTIELLRREFGIHHLSLYQ